MATHSQSALLTLIMVMRASLAVTVGLTRVPSIRAMSVLDVVCSVSAVSFPGCLQHAGTETTVNTGEAAACIRDHNPP